MVKNDSIAPEQEKHLKISPSDLYDYFIKKGLELEMYSPDQHIAELKKLNFIFDDFDDVTVRTTANNACDMLKEISNLYSEHHEMLDDGWLKKVKKAESKDGHEERILELFVLRQLPSSRCVFSKYPANKNKPSPDYLLTQANSSYAFEVTSMRLPSSESVVRSNIERFNDNKRLTSVEDYDRFALCNEVKSRVTQGFIEKANKYHPDRYESRYAQGLIIFISIGKVPFHSQIELYELVSVFLGVGNLTLRINTGGEVIDESWARQSHFEKHNGSPIPNELFLHSEHVSGVILSMTELFNMIGWTKEASGENQICNDFVLIHNPHAKHQISKGLMSVTNEIYLDSENKLKCLNENIFPSCNVTSNKS